MKIARFLFPRKNRLTNKSDFTSLYATGLKKTVGPLLFHRQQNVLGYSRLGLSVPKRVGNAAQRNRIKRLCREAFRQSQFDLPAHFDILITVRPHEIKTLSEYIDLFVDGVQ
jgi:ribonuclease P protein component